MKNRRNQLTAELHCRVQSTLKKMGLDKLFDIYWVNLASGLKTRTLFTIFCDRGHKVTYI